MVSIGSGGYIGVRLMMDSCFLFVVHKMACNSVHTTEEVESGQQREWELYISKDNVMDTYFFFLVYTMA